MNAMATPGLPLQSEASFAESAYEALPLHISGSSVKPVLHYMYVRPHAPKISSSTSVRSLFCANIPVDSTEAHFRKLFADELGGARVASVDIEEVFATGKKPGRGSKRKRGSDAANHSMADAIAGLSFARDREVHKSGSNAVAIFADRASMELAMRAARKSTRKGVRLGWGQGLEDVVPQLGSQRECVSIEQNIILRLSVSQTWDLDQF